MSNHHLSHHRHRCVRSNLATAGAQLDEAGSSEWQETKTWVALPICAECSYPFLCPNSSNHLDNGKLEGQSGVVLAAPAALPVPSLQRAGIQSVGQELMVSSSASEVAAGP